GWGGGGGAGAGGRWPGWGGGWPGGRRLRRGRRRRSGADITPAGGAPVGPGRSGGSVPGVGGAVGGEAGSGRAGGGARGGGRGRDPPPRRRPDPGRGPPAAPEGRDFVEGPEAP